ncbi:peptidyl-prolyl cis-trans isomerase B (cyclophilin B) [Mariniphaga anaerophila]|uniref:peptidylprolyl isomerase n=1 Tax=Mariniphaga anaerophila TaxID=1484053 RepID=A0A1M5BQB3_9BACT|nr:peptidylprolyl isomerase [Mariniphaga anaerophila]SHF44452.1 peptidyl-prolyl cis-trans isomerase B (cyclophilin B) [Mariniphaga anaerophila]
MSKLGIFVFAFFLMGTLSCGNAKPQNEEAQILIKTEYGDMKIKLYDETKEHKKNIEKLVEEDFYNGLLFHRVIQNFMIQGGDPESKNAEPGKQLGGGSLDYTLPAEILPGYYHKRGAVAAARRGGPSNPEKRSSSSQFYIVQGKVFSEGALDTLEIMKNQQLAQEMMREKLTAAQEEIEQYRTNNDRDGFNSRVAEIRVEVDSLIEARGLGFKFTEEQRKIYSTVGGYPSLDGDYTVFGEVVEGMDVVDKIAAVKTDKNNRPLQDVKMKIETIK